MHVLHALIASGVKLKRHSVDRSYTHTHNKTPPGCRRTNPFVRPTQLHAAVPTLCPDAPWRPGTEFFRLVWREHRPCRWCMHDSNLGCLLLPRVSVAFDCRIGFTFVSWIQYTRLVWPGASGGWRLLKRKFAFVQSLQVGLLIGEGGE
jgi:hypothetical protein